MGNTLPSVIDPMKTRLGDPGPGVDWRFEIKWDGYRAIAFLDDGEFKLQGRRLNLITQDFPEIAPLSEAVSVPMILDGELVVFDEQGRPSFQLMQSRKRNGLHAVFLIFDLIWLGERDLRANGYDERRELLESLDLEGSAWSVPARIKATLEEALAATAELGLEGVVAKDAASPYVEGKRNGRWLKVKHGHRQEFLVGGWTPGRGHRTRSLGAILVGYRDRATGEIRYAGRVGTGMGDDLLIALRSQLEELERQESPFTAGDRETIPAEARWCEPRLVIEVRFTEWTRDGLLRNPVFVGFRPDKDPGEVVREQ